MKSTSCNHKKVLRKNIKLIYKVFYVKIIRTLKTVKKTAEHFH